MPEYLLPGQPLYWATACGQCSGGCGIAVKTTDGRAIKMEGTPGHPLSHGKICAEAQAAVQTLYHPNRLNKVTGTAQTWDDAIKALGTQLSAGNQPLFVVRRLSGTLGGLLIDLAKQGGARIWVLDFPSSISERRVMKAVTGKAELPHYPIDEADYLVTFGGDFLTEGHNHVHDSWAFGQFRQGRGRKRGQMVSVGSRINATVASSDRWLACKQGTEGWVALAVGNLLAAKGKGPWPAWAKGVTLEQAAQASGVPAQLITRLANRLAAASKPVVVADSDGGNYVNGVSSQFIIHSLAKMLAGGNLPTFEPDLVLGTRERAQLVGTEEALAHLNSGNCKAVWVFDDLDPLYILPPALKVAEAFGKVPGSVAFATMANTTTAACKTVLPVQMWLEEWGDQRLTRGALQVYNVQQPVVKSKFDQTRSTAEILFALKSPAPQAGGKPVKFYRELMRQGADDVRWEKLLNRGGAWPVENMDWEGYPARVSSPPPVVPDPGAPPAGVNPYDSLDAAKVTEWKAPAASGGMTLQPVVSTLKDGSYGSLPWMQELPDAMTTVVWGGWVEINADKAAEMDIKRHDLIKITAGSVSIEAPAIPLPSVHPDTIAVPVGAEHVDYTAWLDYNQGGKVDFGVGSQAFGPYGYTNTGYARPGVNPLKLLNGQMSDGELSLCTTNVTIEKTGRKQMVTAMDLRVFNLPREILPAE